MSASWIRVNLWDGVYLYNGIVLIAQQPQSAMGKEEPPPSGHLPSLAPSFY